MSNNIKVGCMGGWRFIYPFFRIFLHKIFSAEFDDDSQISSNMPFLDAKLCNAVGNGMNYISTTFQPVRRFLRLHFGFFSFS